MSLPPLIVYVVVASNHYKHSRALAVQLDVLDAKRIAEKLEPEAIFTWRDFGNGAYVEGGTPEGPRNSYSIEPVDVKVR